VTGKPATNVSELIEQSSLSAFQVALLLMCGACIGIDGFDVQAMGFVAPALIREWGIAKASLGPVFGAASLGMLIGSLTFSTLADRIGRRSVLIGVLLLGSLGMLATGRARSIQELVGLRFVTGLGLGGVFPNALALATEFSPLKVRSRLLMLLSCCFTVGAVLGGLLAAALIPAFGWRMVFHLGAVVPLLLVFCMTFFLPESLQFLIVRQGRRAQVVRWLRRIRPTLALDDDTDFIVTEQASSGFPVLQLFQEGRAAATIMMWCVNFMNLLDLYFLSSWLPTVINAAGHSTLQAVLAGTVFQVGGVLGTLALTWLIERLGFGRVMLVAFLLASAAIAAMGQPRLALPVLALAIFLGGLCIIGGQPALNTLAASYYPTALRSTGVGFCLGLGRAGSIAGPVVGGYLLRLQWTADALFLAAAIPALISAGVVLLMQRRGQSLLSSLGRGPART
jgi:AAHS family 4-hydroxybenzoate transporter-like MFS transporter